VGAGAALETMARMRWTGGIAPGGSGRTGGVLCRQLGAATVVVAGWRERAGWSTSANGRREDIYGNIGMGTLAVYRQLILVTPVRLFAEFWDVTGHD
jgi:hypothetical protein